MAPAGRAGSTQGVLAPPRPALGQRAAAAEQQLLQVLEYPRQHHSLPHLPSAHPPSAEWRSAQLGWQNGCRLGPPALPRWTVCEAPLCCAMRAAAAALAVALGAASAQEQNFSVVAPQSNSRIATSECFPLPPQRTIDCSALAHLPWLLLAAQTFGWRSSCRPAAL